MKKRSIFTCLVAVVLLICMIPLTALAVTDKEENNTIAKAQKMTLGETIDGSIAEEGDIDHYSFTISSSGRVTLNITSYMQYYTLHIYDTEGTELWYTDYNEWNSDVGFRKDTHTLDLNEGTYYLKVTGYWYGSWYASTGTYSIQTAFTSANATETESNNSIANADSVQLGNTIVGLIGINDRYDFYGFALGRSGRVTLNMTSYMQYYTLHIYDTEGTELWYTDYNEWNSDVGFRKDTYTIDLEAGTYYLKVTGYWYGGWYASTGTYSIQTAFTSANATETESNNSIAKANPITLNNTVKGLIGINDRYDFYCFTLDKDDSITLDITSYMQYYTLHIYDSEGTELWYTDYNEWNSTSGYRSDSYNLSASTGTYYLKVTGYWYGSWYASTGRYEFSVISPKALANSWVELEGEWYYYDGDSVPVTGWNNLGGKWYYFDADGVMQTGWLQQGNTWYYLKPNGTMATGWAQVDHVYYYFDASGKMVTGWVLYNGAYYYLKPNGTMATGWAQVDHVYYYFDASGKMVTGWVLYNGTYYYMRSNGAMATGWQLVDHVYYYFETSGAMKTGWLLYNGDYYYLKSNGAMATGWVKVGNDWYYMNAGGDMHTGWLQEGSTWYYLKPNGAMATGQYWMNNRYYTFNSSGVWVS